jgi:2-oxoisovalerate dehydrogenase E2 component (dihydrolipoyl transacylase)
VEITSRYDGVVTKLYYNVGEMAKVGSTLIDIEVDDATAAAAHVPHQKPSGGPTRKAPTPVGVTTKQAPPASEKAPAPVVAVAPSLARADPLPEPVRRVDVLDDEKVRLIRMHAPAHCTGAALAIEKW